MILKNKNTNIQWFLFLWLIKQTGWKVLFIGQNGWVCCFFEIEAICFICLYLSKPQQVFKAKYEGLRLYMYIYAIVYKILFCKQVVQLYYIAWNGVLIAFY